MRKHFELCFLVLLTALCSCKKVTLPDPEKQGIAFGMSGFFDQDPIHISIDQPGNRVVTDASFNDTIWSLTGTISPINPSPNNTNPTLEIRLRHPQVGEEVGVDQQMFLRSNWVFYNSQRIKLFHPLQVNVFLEDSTLDYHVQVNRLWRVGDTNDFLFLMENREKTELTLRYSNRDGSAVNSSFVLPENTGSSTLPMAFWDIISQSGSTRQANLKAHLSNNRPVTKIKWSTGEEKETIMVNESGTYGVTITDNSGLQYSHQKTITWNPNERKYRSINFVPKVTATWAPAVSIQDRFQRGTLFIRLKDRRGKWFHSDVNQPDSHIQILEIKPDHDLGNGHKVLAIKLKISCSLQEEGSAHIARLSDFTGWIAVGMPNN